MQKGKGGRPKWIPGPEDIEAARKHAAAGLTEEQISDMLGISQQTLILRKKEYAEFSEAIKKGKAQGIGFVANKLMEQCRDGNTTSLIFYLKTRAGWTETQVNKNEHTGKDGQPLQHNVNISATEEHWDNRMAELIGKE